MDTNKPTAQDTQSAARPRVLSGVVVSDKMNQTVTVAVTRYVKHPKYKKFVKHTKTYHAHNEGNQYKEGDRVRIKECKPISKTKSFIVIDGTRTTETGETEEA